MKSTPVVVERFYDAPVEEVWAAMTDVQQLRQWYFKVDDFRPEVGFVFSFTGQGRKGEQYKHICTVTEVIEHRKLRHTWTYENTPGESVVTFDFFPEADGTKLRVTHEGIESFPQDSDDFAPAGFNAGWTAILGEMLPGFLKKS